MSNASVKCENTPDQYPQILDFLNKLKTVCNSSDTNDPIVKDLFISCFPNIVELALSLLHSKNALDIVAVSTINTVKNEVYRSIAEDKNMELADRIIDLKYVITNLEIENAVLADSVRNLKSLIKDTLQKYR
jgi:hypothetical protein